jgi:hypothetical protein
MYVLKSVGSALFISDCDRANFTAHKRLQIDSRRSPYKLNYKSVLTQREHPAAVANVFSAENAYIDSNRLYTSLTLLLNL